MMQYVLDLFVFVSGVISPTSNSAGTKVELVPYKEHSIAMREMESNH